MHPLFLRAGLGRAPVLASAAILLAAQACSVPLMGRETTWTSRIVLESVDLKFDGCAVGDLEPEHPGAEIGVVAADGSVYVVHRDAEGDFQHTLAWKGPGEIVQCAVGDADPQRPGVELVGVGMRTGSEDSGGDGAVYLVARGDEGWTGERIHVENSLVHGIAIVGGSVWVTGFDEKLSRLRRQGDGTWAVELAIDLPGAGKNIVALDERTLCVACTDGSLVQAQRKGSADEWSLSLLHSRAQGAGRARLGTDGARVVVADDDGSLFLVRPRAEAARRATLLFEDEQKLRGAVLADLEPKREGFEAATAGYSGRVVVLHEPRSRGRDTWVPETVLEGVGRIHHLLAAEVDGRPGIDLVVCSFDGKVYVLSRTADGN